MRRFLIGFFLTLAAWAQGDSPTRYIVQLESEPAVRAGDRAARIAQIGAEHAAFQRSLRLVRNASAVAFTTTASNTVIVEAQPGQLPVLASLPGVRRVEEVRDLKLHLMNALGNHNVAQAWEIAGGVQNAGAGMKIAILDTGIEPTHPAFQAPDLPTPNGYPQANSAANLLLTNKKIIVAKSFDSFDARDTYGHGTAVAAVAAAVVHQSPGGTISGVAPRAWLCVYKVSRGTSGSIPTDFALRAIDAALQDNVHVINMSFGSVGMSGSADDILAEAARNAADSGVIVVASSGNSGPEIMTVDDTAADPKVLAVGSNMNSGATADPAVLLPAGSPLPAAASSNAGSAAAVSGPLRDVTTLDGTGLACNPLPAGSLAGYVPLIYRGECNFSVKLANAKQAGALGGLVYNRADAAEPEALIPMSVDDNPTIPGLFVRYSDGLTLKNAVNGNDDYQVVLRFISGNSDPKRLASFSSPGPPVDLVIKPDLIATGSRVYTATQTSFPSGQIYSSNGYTTVSGTSFSAPMVAGAAAVVRAARPGFVSADYRSMLVNSTVPLLFLTNPLTVQSAGSGMLDVLSAVRSTVTADPISLSFGAQDSTVDAWRQVILRNVTSATRTYQLSVESSDTVKPMVLDTQVTLGAGEIAGPLLVFAGGGLAPGPYQGFLRIDDPASGTVARVPYWLAVRSKEPASVSFPDLPGSEVPGRSLAIYFRVHDLSGLPIMDAQPKVSVVSGGGSVFSVDPSSLYPGLWFVRLQLGTSFGANEFRVDAGSTSRTFSILGSF